MGVVELILFAFALTLVAAPNWKATILLLRKDCAMVKTVLFGIESAQEFVLALQSKPRAFSEFLVSFQSRTLRHIRHSFIYGGFLRIESGLLRSRLTVGKRW